MTSCGAIGKCGRPYGHRGHHGGFRESIHAMPHGLTPAEVDVLRLIAAGNGYQDVAHRRGVAVPTVKGQMMAIRAKLDAASTIAALAKVGWLVVPAA